MLNSASCVSRWNRSSRASSMRSNNSLLLSIFKHDESNTRDNGFHSAAAAA